LCHRAGQETLRRMDFLRMPHLAQVVRLYEDVARACGLLTPAKVVAISLNTGHLDAESADRCIRETSEETGLPATDPVRHGANMLLEALGL
ncbi:MAG: DUF1611 domain-containing protein, partial [Lentisphaeria bacterium]|nr:DUF1611 domain-containing protein [Lentisphaeria bacterium]